MAPDARAGGWADNCDTGHNLALETLIMIVLRFLRVASAAGMCGGLLLLASCGGGSTSAPSPVSSAIPEGAALIDQDGLAFSPNQLTVKAGEKVYFQNSETSLHTVTINGKNESGNMKRHDVLVRTFSEAGAYKITCDFHPQMKATISVR